MPSRPRGSFKDGEQLVTNSSGGFNPKPFCGGQMAESAAIRNGWGAAIAEYFRAQGEVKFIHQTRAEHGIV